MFFVTEINKLKVQVRQCAGFVHAENLDWPAASFPAQSHRPRYQTNPLVVKVSPSPQGVSLLVPVNISG